MKSCFAHMFVNILTASLLFAVYCNKDATNNIHQENDSVSRQESTERERSGKKLKVLLYSLPMAGHYIPLLATGEELARRGHEVTLCTGAELHQDKIKQLAERAGVSYMSTNGTSGFDSLSVNELKNDSTVSKFNRLWSALRNEWNLLLSLWFHHLSLDEHTEPPWDAIIADDFLTLSVMCVHKNSGITVFIQPTTIQSLFQQSTQWFVPSVMSGNMSALHPSFFDRLKALIGSYLFKFMKQVIILLFDNAIYCPDASADHLIPDSAVFVPIFIPTVIGFEYPRTYPPMTHYLGPLLSKSPPAIPKDLQQWLKDRPERSVVYISTGSMFEVTYDIGKAIIDGILRTKYSAIWAVRQPEIVDRLRIDAKRIFTMEWAPQLSVLQHKAIGMAILHGGANGVNEALYNGVPPIVLPFGADQQGIASRVACQGLGRSLDVGTITAEKITSSIAEISSGDYRRNVERLQKIFVSAGGVEKAADLVEYYKEVGFDHLIPAYAKYEWSWVQYYNVDVYALLAVILVSVIYCSLKCCQFVCRRTCCKRKEKD